jgi:ribA/ribD-fused uncharacterized protein
MEEIRQFIGEYRFLSNFYISPVLWGNFIYPSSEHAYQSEKTLDAGIRAEFRNFGTTPGMAKHYARTLKLREDWEQIKDQVMYEVVRSKFINLKLAAMLVNTGTRKLVEGNNWHDTYWGVCNGEHIDKGGHPGIHIGENKLGQIIERVRSELLERPCYSAKIAG